MPEMRKDNVMSEITLSAKQLDFLCKPGACPRCFWILSRVGHKLPFEKFAGIVFYMDSFEKGLVDTYFEKHGKLPKWLSAGAVEAIGLPFRDFRHARELSHTRRAR